MGRRASRRVSIKDIARKAGVSHSTVSRALRGSPLVNPRTAERIRRLAARMGYVPNAAARSLVTTRTSIIGLVITTLADPFLAEIVRGVEEVALEAGYRLFLATSNADPEREMAAVRALAESRVEGVIVASSRVGDLYLPHLEALGVPIVLINNQREEPFIYSVASDSRQGAVEAVSYLVRLGHTRIAYIAGPPTARSNRERLAGYQEAMAQAGLSVDPAWIVEGNGRPEGGEWGIRRLLEVPRRPTAVFCYNDMTAIGALRAARAAGLRVPEDLSIIGFDDILFAAYTEPPLTTVAQPKYEMGRTAMSVLLRLLQGERTPAHLRLPCRLVERASCGPPLESAVPIAPHLLAERRLP
ncbi:LacI family DNA-binding transcriptional regulator [Thermoflexus sp.]|uniref:LacI family DNA-binding transcriptional regulator n=1 Tax=Thermoflexus sp. TaxID=1969742 RepID=UPI00177035CD|nr:LacI family DNA-binding transcriptional regulator [Thermoflexus sp.]